MGQVPQPHAVARPKAPPRPARETRDGDDKGYLALLRQCPCAADRAYHTIIEPHHQNHLWPGRGKSQKCPDRLCIPLSKARHDELHRYGTRRHEAILEGWGIDGEALANELWHIHKHEIEDRKLELMRAAVMGHGQAGPVGRAT
ncbi:MAG: hypothetical protein ACR2OF_00040 [Hyphomicrobium sp.]